MSRTATLAVTAVFMVAFAAIPVAKPARAQVPSPPMTVFGSVTDASGEVPADLAVEAYVGDKVCGKGKTQFTGDGSGKVTVYFADVVSREQTAGCGSEGVEVRIKIGDRFAPQTVKWAAGPKQLDVVFGNATPAAIPTFTPTPRPSVTPTSATARPSTPTAGASVTPPTASVSASVSPAGSPSAEGSATGTASPTATLTGGIVTEPGSAGDDDEPGGFPVWGYVAIGLGVLAAAGGGIGFAMARSRPVEDDAPGA